MANVLESPTNVLGTITNHSEIKNQAYPQVFHDIDHGVVTILTTDLTDWTDLTDLTDRLLWKNK